MYEKCLDEGKNLGCPNYINYINSYYWKCKEKWCLCYRDYTVRGHQTNNFSEAAISYFKDLVLARVKAYNAISLVDFSCTSLEEMYQKGFRDFANFLNHVDDQQ